MILVHGLYVILNRTTQSPETVWHLCSQVLTGGANVVQYRDKNSSSEEIRATAHRLVKMCRRYAVPLLLNDYVHIANQVHADGVHLGEEDGDWLAARQLLGPGRILGISASNPEQARLAVAAGADYIGCGHVFPTSSKMKKTSPIGMQGLKRVVRSVSIPVMAIGGIIEERIVPIVKEASPAGIVVIAAVNDSADPAEACRRMRKIWTSSTNAKLRFQK